MNIRTLLAHIKYCLAKKLWKYAPYIKNDKLYIRIKYLLFLNKWCNLKHPKTFCEKLQWLKLHDHKPIYHQMVDKAEAKKFIADRVGGEYVIPTIGVWDRFEDIDFDVLPNEFILKNTHDSGTYCVCTDKTTLNINKVKERMSVTWNIDYSVYSREWPYKGVKSRIIAEPLLRDSDSPFLTDYKFFTFNGEPKFYYTTSNRGKEGGLKEDFFDIEGKLLPFTQKGYPNNPRIPSLPVNLYRMVEIARILSSDTYHLRVDFYEVNGRLYVGEMTFFDGGGFAPFFPNKYNLIIGEMINLPIGRD